MKKKILIFGATGNLGLYFVDYFISNANLKKYELIAIGRKKTNYFNKKGIEYINVDINKDDDFKNLPKDNVYAIVDFAGVLPAYLASEDNVLTAETNFVGSIRILEYARKVKVDRFLYMQTWAEMAGYWGTKSKLSPKLQRKLIYTGDHAIYSISKSATVEAMEYYHQTYGIKNFVFRLPNIYLYSPINDYYVDGIKKPISYRYLINQAINGEDIELWGNPKAYKDIVYVKDFCQMVYKALYANVDGGTYCVGTGVKTSFIKQIKGIIDVFSPRDRKSKIIYKPEKASFTSFVMDIENAKRDLGYKPQYDYISYLKDYKKEMEMNKYSELLEK